MTLSTPIQSPTRTRPINIDALAFAHIESVPGPVLDPTAALIFVINAASGQHDADATRLAIEQELVVAGRTGELLQARPHELARIAKEAAATAMAQRTAVVAVGGDGTINAVAQAAHALGCAMGVVPQGTFNYFARTHGLPTDAAEATRALLRCLARPVQVGMINDHVFLVNASLGLYPELLEDRESYKARFGRSRLVALVSTVATLLGAHRQLHLRIERGTGVRDVVTPTLFVGNNRLQLEQVGLAEATAIEQGSIAAVMLRPISMLSMFGLLFRGAMGTLGEADSVESFQFRRILVKLRPALGSRMIKVAFDGEVSRMRPPLEFRVSDKPLYVLKGLGEPESTHTDSDKA
jgi:diacylglycerol kinase family enzyme